jgi:monoamine oxidase
MSGVSVYDTIIVGAGASGLTAGYELIRRTGSDNDKIRILEASSVWGGRVRKLDDSFAGFPIDIGGGWIHENAEGYPNARVLDSIINNPEVTVTTKTAVDEKPFVSYDNGEEVECPPMGDGGSDVLDEIFVNSTWYDFLATYIYPTVKDHINYDCPVSLIDYSDVDSVYLECENGAAMQANNVIVTASVEVLRTGVITFKPSLPEEYAAILEAYAFTRVFKGFITFSDAFYEEGKSFQIFPPF